MCRHRTRRHLGIMYPGTRRWNACCIRRSSNQNVRYSGNDRKCGSSPTVSGLSVRQIPTHGGHSGFWNMFNYRHVRISFVYWLQRINKTSPMAFSSRTYYKEIQSNRWCRPIEVFCVDFNGYIGLRLTHHYSRRWVAKLGRHKSRKRKWTILDFY